MGQEVTSELEETKQLFIRYGGVVANTFSVRSVCKLHPLKQVSVCNQGAFPRHKRTGINLSYLRKDYSKLTFTDNISESLRPGDQEAPVKLHPFSRSEVTHSYSGSRGGGRACGGLDKTTFKALYSFKIFSIFFSKPKILLNAVSPSSIFKTLNFISGLFNIIIALLCLIRLKSYNG